MLAGAGYQCPVIENKQLREILHGYSERSSASARAKKVEELLKKKLTEITGFHPNIKQSIAEGTLDRFILCQIHPLDEHVVEANVGITDVEEYFQLGKTVPETSCEAFLRICVELEVIAKTLQNKEQHIGISTHGALMTMLKNVVCYYSHNVLIPPFYAKHPLVTESGEQVMPPTKKTKNCEVLHCGFNHTKNRLEIYGAID